MMAPAFCGHGRAGTCKSLGSLGPAVVAGRGVSGPDIGFLSVQSSSAVLCQSHRSQQATVVDMMTAVSKLPFRHPPTHRQRACRPDEHDLLTLQIAA